MGTDDWFGRERGLGEAENSNLVYAGDFDANEIELLELSDDLLRRALDGEELVFKGAHDEEAVLCTNDTTYLVKRVETSNTLLLIRGAAGVINDTVDGVDGNPSQNQNENDTTTPAKRRRSSVSEFPSTPSTTPKPAHLRTTFLPNEENQPDLVAHAQAESHLELIETEPRMEKVWAALANAPHAFAGTDNDKKLDETWFGNFTDGDVGEEGVPDPPKKGLTEDEVVDLARASRSECLDLLRLGAAFRDERTSRWRGIDLEWRDHLLDVLLVTAGANGWGFGKIPGDKMCDALVTDGFPHEVTKHTLKSFSNDGANTEFVFSIDTKKVCFEKASRLLFDRPVPTGSQINGRWRLDAFLDTWRVSLPEEMRDTCQEELLQGLALLEKPAGAAVHDPKTVNALTAVRPLRASDFPRDPQERFKTLWQFKPKWTLDEMKPYLQPTTEMNVEAQLLKFTRVTQPNAKATAAFSKR